MSVLLDTIKTYIYVAGYIIFLSVMMTMLYGVQKHRDFVCIIQECSKMIVVSSNFAFIWPVAMMVAIATAIDKTYSEL